VGAAVCAETALGHLVFIRFRRMLMVASLDRLRSPVYGSCFEFCHAYHVPVVFADECMAGYLPFAFEFGNLFLCRIFGYDTDTDI